MSKRTELAVQTWECFACEGTGRGDCADCGGTGVLRLHGLTKRGVNLLIELAVKTATSRLIADRDALAREVYEKRAALRELLEVQKLATSKEGCPYDRSKAAWKAARAALSNAQKEGV